MLTLTIGRDTFKICHKEGARTTVWDVSKNDSEESLIQTFRDVIAFVEGPEAPGLKGMAQALADFGDRAQPRLGEIGHYGGVDIPAEPTNGWAAFSATLPPELPERLEGEVELVTPGENE